MACLQLFYGVGRDTEEGRAGRGRFERQGWCGRCRCLMAVGEECKGCVVFAGRVAEEEETRAERKETAERDFFSGGGGGDVYSVPAGAWDGPDGENGGYVDYVDFLFGEEEDGGEDEQGAWGGEGMVVVEELVEEHGVEEPAQPPPVRFRPVYPGDEDGQPPSTNLLESIEIWLTYKSLLGATVSRTVAVAGESAASSPAREALRLVSSSREAEEEEQWEVPPEEEQREVPPPSSDKRLRSVEVWLTYKNLLGTTVSTVAGAGELAGSAPAARESLRLVTREAEGGGDEQREVSRRRSWLLALLGRREWRTVMT